MVIIYVSCLLGAFLFTQSSAKGTINLDKKHLFVQGYKPATFFYTIIYTL